MPIYEYKCEDCGKISEFLDNKNKLKCSSCGSLYLKKQFSTFSVVNKGNITGSDEKSCCGMTDPCDNPKRCCSK
ncbi:MAG TPA: zinc ribbon domain-containing protein [Candidatus Eremiobacteraeota bacterium]|nr:MAG: Zinc ribbon domain protein [bacterium ADurb.Bin363]HPZ07083.1 zinc ribbon domain-containing protein [Candidatus Eremiobacteraeota bacterium]